MRRSDGRLVHVSDVQNGLKCGCICPACKSPLIARQGKKRDWHFAHVSDVNCSNAGETALHLAAKQALKHLNGQIFIPEEVIRKQGWPPPNQWDSRPMARLYDLMTHTFPKRRASESIVRIEPQDWARQGFRPDAVLEKYSGALLIEIRVTHEVDEEKQRLMRKVGLGVIEIDLSETDRHIAPDELTSLIVSEAPRKWLVTGRKEAWKKLEAEFTKKLKAEASRLNGMIPRDLTRHYHVNACPRRNEPGFESVYIDQCQNCKFYGGHLDSFRDTPIWHMLDDNLRHVHEKSVLCMHKANAVNLPTEKQKKYVRDLACDDLKREGGLTAWLPTDWEKDKEFCSTFISAHPDCKECGTKMALRRNKKQFFWGCSQYPYCRETSSCGLKPPLASIVKLHEQEQRNAHEEHEDIAAAQSALERREAGFASLSQMAMPFSPRSAKR